MDKIAICKLIPRVNSAPRLVALLPQVNLIQFFNFMKSKKKKKKIK